MLQPKKTKYTKYQKNRYKGFSNKCNVLKFGDYGIKAINKKYKYLTSAQIEAARVAATRFMRKEGKLYINIFPDKPITKKPQEVRMGKGKGNVVGWVVPIRPGRILFEIKNISKDIAKEALRLCASKLPIKTKFIIKIKKYEEI